MDGDKLMMQILLDAGAEPNEYWGNWNTILELIQDHVKDESDAISKIELLVEYGADIDFKTNVTRKSPLERAVFKGYPMITEFILYRGKYDIKERSYVLSAMISRSKETMKILLVRNTTYGRGGPARGTGSRRPARGTEAFTRCRSFRTSAK
jgi:hypothetical protein